MSANGTRELLIFEVSGINFALPLSVVEEVVPSNSVTAIPSSPPFLLGLSAVRGKVMGVIDAAHRYGIRAGLNAYFVVCQVRGNSTAITIDRAIVAGAVYTRDLDAAGTELLQKKSTVNRKFIKGAFELLEKVDDLGATRPTGLLCLEVHPDLFVSAEMASRVGEAA